VAVEKPLVATSMEPFGSAFPQTDAFSTEGGVFKIDAPGAIETPCEMVSIASTKEDMSKMSRAWDAGVLDLPNDTANAPY
jgi:hypothetical protein